MEWSDRGIILGTKKYGETSVILEVMTEHHGRHMGLIRAGRSKKMHPILQSGNDISVVWRARLEGHLGIFTIEPVRSRAGEWMQSRLHLSALQTLCALLRLLPEREAQPQLYQAAQIFFAHHQDTFILAELLIRLELNLLRTLGFGLDLDKCAMTNTTKNLAYVSPKTGRAVSEETGKHWKTKLLKLPEFLTSEHAATADRTTETLKAGFQLSEYFMNRHIFEPRGVTSPETRHMFIKQVIAQKH